MFSTCSALQGPSPSHLQPHSSVGPPHIYIPAKARKPGANAPHFPTSLQLTFQLAPGACCTAATVQPHSNNGPTGRKLRREAQQISRHVRIPGAGEAYSAAHGLSGGPERGKLRNKKIWKLHCGCGFERTEAVQRGSFDMP